MSMTDQRWSQARVGLLVALAGVLAFGAVTYVGLAGTPFAHRALIHAHLDDVSGLALGSRVEMGGVKVGEISAVELPDLDTGRVPLTLAIEHRALEKLGASSRVYLGSHALVGQRFVGLTPRKPDEQPLASGAHVEAKATVDTQALLDRAAHLMDQFDGLITDLRSISSAIGAAAGPTSGPVGVLLHDREAAEALHAALLQVRDFTRLAASGNGALATLVGDPKLAADLREGTRAFATTARRLNEGQGVLGRLMHDDRAARSLERTFANLETVSGRLADTKGTLGALISDPAMLAQLNALVGQLDSLVGDLRRHPQRYLKIDAF